MALPVISSVFNLTMDFMPAKIAKKLIKSPFDIHYFIQSSKYYIK